MNTSAQTDKADLQKQMNELGEQAREAARILTKTPAETKNKALQAMAAEIRKQKDLIQQANDKDMTAAEQTDMAASFLDRLKLTDDRIEAMAKGLEDIASLTDPVGDILAEWDRPNGLKIQRVRVPLGVIGVIYESRPNVTADAGGLCMKSGNAAILRGGSDSFHSSRAIEACLKAGLASEGLPEASIQLVPTTDRAAVGMMLKGLNSNVDVIVPRGGKSLVARVQEEARVPVFSHLEGICHVYIDGDADLEMAKAIIVNAKMRRTGICGAAETMLVDAKCAPTHLQPLLDALHNAECAVRGDDTVCNTDDNATPATEEDWTTEYLDSLISVKLVNGIEEAINHINKYGSQHTDCIVSENTENVARFLNEVDSAIVLHNASTQFADGGEFGMGAEIGIATGKMHARGPVGVEQLTSFKYVVRGNGQTRP